MVVTNVFMFVRFALACLLSAAVGVAPPALLPQVARPVKLPALRGAVPQASVARDEARGTLSTAHHAARHRNHLPTLPRTISGHEAESKLLEILSSGSKETAAAQYESDVLRLPMTANGALSVPALLDLLELARPPPTTFDLGCLVGTWALLYTDELPIALREEAARHAQGSIIGLSVSAYISDTGVMDTDAVIEFRGGESKLVSIMNGPITHKQESPLFWVSTSNGDTIPVEVTYSSEDVLVLRKYSSKYDELLKSTGIYPAAWKTEVWSKRQHPNLLTTAAAALRRFGSMQVGADPSRSSFWGATNILDCWKTSLATVLLVMFAAVTAGLRISGARLPKLLQHQEGLPHSHLELNESATDAAIINEPPRAASAGGVVIEGPSASCQYLDPVLKPRIRCMSDDAEGIGCVSKAPPIDHGSVDCDTLVVPSRVFEGYAPPNTCQHLQGAKLEEPTGLASQPESKWLRLVVLAQIAERALQVIQEGPVCNELVRSRLAMVSAAGTFLGQVKHDACGSLTLASSTPRLRFMRMGSRVQRHALAGAAARIIVGAYRTILTNPVQYLTIPLVAAIVGYGTNWVGVKMIFYPINFWGIKLKRWTEQPLGLIGWQGIVPCKVKKMSTRLVDIITLKLLTMKEAFAQLDPVQLTALLEPRVAEAIERDPDIPFVWKMAVKFNLKSVMIDVVKEMQEDIDNLIDLREVVSSAFQKDKVLLGQLFQKAGRKELAFLVNSGFGFGFVLGIFQMAWWIFLPRVWTLPAGGALVGYITNLVAVKLIFDPVEPTKVGPFTVQGLFEKRQPEVSLEFSDFLATRVLSSPRIIYQLANGPLSANFEALLIKKMPGPPGLVPRAVIDAALGAFQDLAREPNTVPFHVYVDRTMALDKILYTRLKALSASEFENLLHPVFEEDELTLIIAGGVLGAAAGAAQTCLAL